MSSSAEISGVTAFNVNPLEELLWSISASSGEFSIVLAHCNYLELRDRMIRKIKAELADLPNGVVVFTLDPRTRALYRAIQEHLQGQIPGALLVLGLEMLQDLDQVLAATNQVREEFRRHLRCPIVLWVNDTVKTHLARLAPDFESLATTTEFKISTEHLVEWIEKSADQAFAVLLTRGATRFLDNLATESLSQSAHYAELSAAAQELSENLKPFALGKLQDRQIDSANIRDKRQFPPLLWADLQFLLGQALPLGSVQAREHYEQSLEAWRVLLDEPPSPELVPTIAERLGILLYQLGLWWQTLATHQPAQSGLAYDQARHYYKQCIAHFEQSDRPDLMARFINALGNLLENLTAWDELETVGKHACLVHQRYPNPFRLARAYGFMASTALARNHWDRARSYAQQAIDLVTATQPDVLTMSGDRERVRSLNRGGYLFTLALAQRGLGQFRTSLTILEQALEETRPYYELHLYRDILQALRDGYFQQGNYLKAFEYKQQRRSLEQQFGLRAFIGAGRLQPNQRVLRPDEAEKTPQQTVAQEIDASGRRRDIDALIERIGRSDHKLIVIHGLSGVGKSSILQAGLLPALQERALGSQQVASVYLRTYRDWVAHLGNLLTEVLKTHEIFLPTLLAQPANILEQLALGESRNLRTVLIFDQFEEFFFINTQAGDRQPFFDFLAGCLNTLSVKVVLSLREDYLHCLLEVNRHPGFSIINNDILSKSILYRLGNLAIADARTLVQDLTSRSQIYLEPALIDALIDDLANGRGEVRPIELQIVGAEMYREGITTLKDYHDRGPKEALVQRYLKEVVEDCGPENSRAADLVLYLLTDEQGTRPVKTRTEVELGLKALAEDLLAEADKLDLVLSILVHSGLVALLRENAVNRYQLVHDYLSVFIRQQQQPKLEKLIVELEQEKRHRQQISGRLNRFLRGALVVSVIAGLALAGLSIVSVVNMVAARRQRQIAENSKQIAEDLRVRAERGELVALSKTSEALFEAGLTFEALLEALRAGDKLKGWNWAKSDLQLKTQVQIALQQAIVWVRERNRLEGHNGIIWDVSYSPDGQWIASASGDNTIRLWRVNGTLAHTLQGHQGQVLAIAFSPDSSQIVSAGQDGTIRLWALNGQLIRTIAGHQGSVNSVSFSPDGQRLASAGDDATVRLWQVKGRLLKTLVGHDAAVQDVSFSPDGQFLVSGSDDTTLRLWQKDGAPIAVLKGHTGQVYAVQFSPNSQWIASASWDTTVRLWRKDGRPVRTIAAHDNLVYDVTFSPDSQRLVTAGWDKLIKIWQLDGTLLSTFAGHNSQVRGVSFSPDGNLLASGGGDRSVKIWQLNRPHLQVLQGHDAQVYDVRFSPDSRTIASASADRTVKIWSPMGKLLRTLTGHSALVWSVSYSPDGKTLASASSDNTVRLWNIASGKTIATLKDHGGPVYAVRFSPNGQFLASGSEDQKVRIWRSNGQFVRILGQPDEWHTDGILGLSYSPNGLLIASSSWDKTVKLWQPDGKLISTLRGHTGWVYDVAFSPDGKMFATASYDSTVRLWQTQPGKLLKVLKGHQDGVVSVQFSPDSKVLATTSYDGTVRIWNPSGDLLTILRGHSAGVSSASFSADNQLLATSSDDRTILIWRIREIGDLDTLMELSCEWLANYLHSNPGLSHSDRTLCEGVSSPDHLDHF